MCKVKYVLYLCIYFLFYASPILADRLITTQGKILQGKVTEQENHYLVAISPQAVIRIPKALIMQVNIEGDMSSYQPKDDNEKELIAKGMVKYKDQWLSKDRYELESKKDQEELNKQIEEFKKHTEWGYEWTKETKHVEYHCNASPEILDQYIELFEGFMEAYLKKLQRKIPPEINKKKIILRIFRDEEAFLDYTKVGRGVGGFFRPGDVSLNLYHDFEVPEFSRMVLFHEGVHLLNYINNPDLFRAQPIWIEESSAEYFANVELSEKSKKLIIEPGAQSDHRIGQVKDVISSGNSIKLEKLLLAEQNQFDAYHYAFGWSFVHFLANHKKYSKGFFSFYKDIYQGKGMKFENSHDQKYISPENAKEALVKYIKTKDIESLEAEWMEYVNQLQIQSGIGYFYRARSAFNRKGGELQIDEKDEGQKPLELINKAILVLGYKTSSAYYLRAQIWHDRKENEKALKDVETAIELNPVHPAYYVGRAWLANLKNDHTKAENDLTIAVALDPFNVDARIFLDQARAKKWEYLPDGF